MLGWAAAMVRTKSSRARRYCVKISTFSRGSSRISYARYAKESADAPRRIRSNAQLWGNLSKVRERPRTQAIRSSHESGLMMLAATICKRGGKAQVTSRATTARAVLYGGTHAARAT